MATTIQSLRDRLLSDPHFVFQYIYGNNPDQVIEHLRALGFRVSTADDVMNATGTLIEQGRGDLLAQVYSVPFLTDQVDPAEVTMMQEVATAMAANQATITGGPKRAVKIDWGNVLGVVAGGAAAVLLSQLGGGQQQQQQQQQQQPLQPQPKDNTKTILMIVGGTVLLAVILVLVFKKK